jgi:AraC family transcriptional regulator, arabinose operon regulatory protein
MSPSLTYFDDLRFLGGDELPDFTTRIDQRFPPSVALNFMVSGRITFQVAEGPTHTLNGPLAFVIHGGIRHRYVPEFSSPPWHLLWVMVDGPRLRRWLAGGLMLRGPAPFARPADPAAYLVAMRRLVELVRRGRAEDQAERVLTFERLLANAIAAPPGANVSAAPAQLEAAIDALADRIAREPSASWNLVAEAKKIGVSLDHFRRVFTRRIGAPPQAHLLDSRVRWAAARLTAGAGSVKTVAAEAGFDNAFYFSRVFRARLGFPPSRLRPRLGGAKRERDTAQLPQ